MTVVLAAELESVVELELKTNYLDFVVGTVMLLLKRSSQVKRH